MNLGINHIASGSILAVAKKSKAESPEERAKYIEQLAEIIISDATRRAAERRRLADEGTEKIRRHFADKQKRGSL